jgi:hypothetical protein
LGVGFYIARTKGDSDKMKCFLVKIANDSQWMSDGRIQIEFMVLAEDFISATMRGHDVMSDLMHKLIPIAEGNIIGKDLDSTRVIEVHETCSSVIDGIGKVSGTSHGVDEAVEYFVKKLAKTKD